MALVQERHHRVKVAVAAAAPPLPATGAASAGPMYKPTPGAPRGGPSDVPAGRRGGCGGPEVTRCTAALLAPRTALTRRSAGRHTDY